jgi:hypothetical protein
MQRFKVFLVIAMASVFAVGYGPDGGNIDYAINMSVQDGRLFVSDVGVGVHVYDVADPANPSLLYTIPLQGNTGNAAVGDVLYASNYTSIKAFHLGSESYVEVASIERERQPPPFNEGYGRSKGYGCSCENTVSSPARAPTQSQGSSYATFAVVGDYLYYIDYDYLVALDVSDPLKPRQAGKTRIGWDVQTIYPAGQFLFIGGAVGMYIYDRTDPTAPVEVGRLVHTRACDPVVVDGATAFVTLRGAGQCGGVKDELLSIDITDPAAPKLLCETDVLTPYGLAADAGAGRLYVSKGANGFVLFDVSAPDQPTPIASWEGETKDFIWTGGVLYSMTSGQVRVYDVTDPTDPTYVSTLD